jgi:hypothetical protein
MHCQQLVVDRCRVLQVPDEIIWTICLYISEPSDLSALFSVSKQWKVVLENNMLWREKLLESNWMMQYIPQDHLVMTLESYAQMLERERREDEEEYMRLVQEAQHDGSIDAQQLEDIRDMVRGRKKARRVFLVRNCFEQYAEYLHRANRLCKTLLNDWICYWASNFQFSDSEDSTDELETPSHNKNLFVFRTPVQMYQCGIACFGDTRLKQIYPGEKIASQSVDTLSYRMCYENIFKLLHLLPSMCQLRPDPVYEWSDPCINTPTPYPIIPFISFNFPEDKELNLQSFTTHIGAHRELYTSNDVCRWKTIEYREDTNHEDEEVPIDSPTLTVKLHQIFPEEKHMPYRNFVKRHLADAKFCVLGQTQLNPIPLFIVGIIGSKKSKERHLCGLFTSTFRSPN